MAAGDAALSWLAAQAPLSRSLRMHVAVGQNKCPVGRRGRKMLYILVRPVFLFRHWFLFFRSDFLELPSQGRSCFLSNTRVVALIYNNSLIVKTCLSLRTWRTELGSHLNLAMQQLFPVMSVARASWDPVDE